MATKLLYGPYRAGYASSKPSTPVVITPGLGVELSIADIRTDASADHVDVVAAPYDAVGTPRLVRVLVAFGLVAPAEGQTCEQYLASAIVGAVQVEGDGSVEQRLTVDVIGVPDDVYHVQTVLEVSTPDQA